jgi:hypothetical protein
MLPTPTEPMAINPVLRPRSDPSRGCDSHMACATTVRAS